MGATGALRRAVGQGAGFAGSQVVISLLGAVSTLILTRALSTTAFGNLSFATAFLLFAALFFDFGLFLPMARRAASSPEGARQIVGAGLLAFAPVGALFVIVVVLLSYGVDGWFNVNVKTALLLSAPVAIVYPFQLVAMYVAQGLDRLHIYSVASVAGQAVFLVAVGGCVLVTPHPSVALVLLVRGCALIVGATGLVVWARPVFSGAAHRVRELVGDARDWGFQVYVGRVLSVGTYNMDALMLGAFTDARTVGFYALAGSVAYVAGLPVIGMTTALFPRMTTESVIDRRLVLTLACVAALSSLVVAVAAYPLVPLIFSSRYEPAVAVVLPLAVAAGINGVTSIYNQFLSARGRGKELRDAGLILTVSNLIFNFALIPPFGAVGAGWASVGALVVNLAAYVRFYTRLRLPQQLGPDPATLG